MASFTEAAALKEGVVIQKKQTGIDLQDFGDRNDFDAPLKLIIEDLNSAPLPEQSRHAVYKLLARNLAFRLQIVELMKQHADLLEKTPVPPILFLASLVRSGSTLFHNLLHHAIEGNRSLLKWEMISPIPLADTGKLLDDPRVSAISSKLHQAGNRYASMHFVDADEPEETVFFTDDLWGLGGQSVQNLLPRYQQWIRDPNAARTAFQRLRKVIRLFMVLNPPAPGARLVLKCPQEIEHLQTWSDVFPEASIVLLHRDPYRVFDSSFHMVRMTNEDYKASQSVGELVDKLFSMVSLGTDALMNFKGWAASMRYGDLLNDPVGETLRCLQACGVHCDSAASNRIERFLDMQKKKRKPAPKDLSTTTHGVTAAEVHERMKEYMAKFQIPNEATRQIDVQRQQPSKL